MTLPEGWIPKAPPKTAKVDQFAVNTDAGTYFELVAEPREDFAESVDLPAWAKSVKEQSSKTSKLVNRKDTDLTAGKVADHDTQEYEVTGEINGSKLHYRIMMVRVGDWFVKLTCWTTPSRWKAAQPKFDELVDHLK